MVDNKSITLVSNNYWTLYKFRYEVIELFLSEGFQINFTGKMIIIVINLLTKI